MNPSIMDMTLHEEVHILIHFIGNSCLSHIHMGPKNLKNNSTRVGPRTRFEKMLMRELLS
jgi:hypothetical protein